MQLSVIILNYNVRYFLEQCVLSVQRALEDIDGEIIVVDNNSSDDSCAMMRSRFPNVKLIENNDNLGFPKGNNLGVAEAKGEYICILNPDTVVAEDTFSKVLQFVKSSKVNHSELGIVGGKLVDGTGTFLPESKRGVPTPWVAFTKIFGLYKMFPKSHYCNKYYAQHLTDSQTGEVDILVGAFMVLKRDLYLEVGGFDENCFMYSDDIDLSYRVQQLGRKNYYFADTTIIHYKGESTIRDGIYMKRFREAMQFFYKKHFKKSVFFDVMMQVGSFVFALLKKNQQKVGERKIEEYVVFTKERLELELPQKSVYFADFDTYKGNVGGNVEFVFDVDSFSFQQCIAFMEQHKAKNSTFKNFLKDGRYLIGSNNSNDRGQIILL